jgi:anaerobic ribonucleoside-triphosphate reductase activating protein
MHIGQIFTADCANGIGMRVSVFVSGCTNHCKGCFQPETWDFSYGQPYTHKTEVFLLEELAKPYYDGLTILGGEPFESSNQEVLVTLLRRVKRELPEKNIWMYTGFVYDRDLVPGGCRYTAATDEILDAIDILVDGRFEESQKDITLKFRGSANQRIIDMPATRASGTVVLSPLNH